MKLKKVLALMSDPYWQLLVSQTVFLVLAASYLELDLKRSLLFTQLACICIDTWIFWRMVDLRESKKGAEK